MTNDDQPNRDATSPTNGEAVRSGDWLGLWKRAAIVAVPSALLPLDTHPKLVAIPLVVGTLWNVWVELRKRPSVRVSDSPGEI